MKLLTKADAAKIPALYSQEKNPNPTAQVKFFDPFGSWTWFVLEHDGNGLFFGLVYGFDVELGYFTLAELEGLKGAKAHITVNDKQLDIPHTGIERDTGFSPIAIREVVKEMTERGYSVPVVYQEEA